MEDRFRKTISDRTRWLILSLVVFIAGIVIESMVAITGKGAEVLTPLEVDWM